MPRSRSARAAWVTTLLCMLPPSMDSGWQMTAMTGRDAVSPSGRSTATSSGPTGPARVSVVDSWGKGGVCMGVIIPAPPGGFIAPSFTWVVPDAFPDPERDLQRAGFGRAETGAAPRHRYRPGGDLELPGRQRAGTGVAQTLAALAGQ